MSVMRPAGMAKAAGSVWNHAAADMKRDVHIEEQKHDFDQERRHVGHMEREFAADGKITPGEQKKIHEAQANLGHMGHELQHMKQHDAQMDKRDQQQGGGVTSWISNLFGGLF